MNDNPNLQHELFGLILEATAQEDLQQALELCLAYLKLAPDPAVDTLRKSLSNKIKDGNIKENIRQFLARIRTPLPPRESQFRPEVIIPCFNQGHLLGDALASLPDGVPVTVVNDASTDDTADHIDSLFTDYSFKLITNTTNLNQGGSINRAISHSENNLFIMLNADDALTRYAIPTILDILERYPEVRMAGGECCPFDDPAILARNNQLPTRLPYQPEPRIFTPADALSFHHPNDINLTMSSCSFLRSAWIAAEGFWEFDRRVCSFDDRDFQMRVCARTSVAVLKEILAFYRVTSSVGRGRSL